MTAARYFVHNDITARMYGGLALAQRNFYIHPKDYIAARELLKDLLIDRPIPQNILDQISEEDTPPVEMSKEDREASRYRFFTISLLAIFAFYVLYKISANE